jgi:uroporphyrinogen-III decarboxylase
MMAPAMFATLVTPYQKRLIAQIHEAGFPASIHCHGRVRDVIDEVIKTGADVLEPIEPPDQGDMTLQELFDKAGDRLCVMGHIQDQELHYVPPGTMTKWVEGLARIANGRTGYVMTPTCTPFQHPATDTFQRNYEEWILAADRLLG